MKNRVLVVIMMLVGLLSLHAQAVPVTLEEPVPVIQLALLLDTSNSMDGLINQAKGQLWKIVSQTSRERYAGNRVRLEVALYEYGNDSLNIMSGYVRQVVPFTTDLDLISQRLFELDTNGGSEYCGKVMQSAQRQLNWDSNPRSLKMMFIAGNEPFNQGPVDFVRTAQGIYRRGITVNTIFCGAYEEGRMGYWEEGARLAGGRYMNINADYEHAHVATPYDDRLSELNRRLNDTYLGYGTQGEVRKENQAAQDSNARGLSLGSLLDRAAVKSSESYSNSEWDLVDAYEEGAVELEEMPAAALPEPMREMDEAQRGAYVEEMSRERRLIQEEMALLSVERESYLAEQTAAPAEETLDSAMVEAIREAAAAKGFDSE